MSGVLHVLYYAMRACLEAEHPAEVGVPAEFEDIAEAQLPDDFVIPATIPESVAQMAVHLTEYYQGQRMAYEQVSKLWAVVHV